MSNHINPDDVIGVGSGGDAAGAGTYTVDLFDIDGGIAATLGHFTHASAAAVFAANMRRIVGDWLEAAETCGRDNFVDYLKARQS